MAAEDHNASRPPAAGAASTPEQETAAANGAIPPEARPSHVVGIGASAGGLDALEQFFGSMPADSGLAFVVIQHLSPDFKSVMDELLARYTKLNIHHASDGMPVARDSIYLIPPRKNLVMREGRLYLVEQQREHGLNLPIDAFFRSLAKDQGENAIAIILSGTGSDGTSGVRAIKEVGGMVMVQDEESAQFDGMPRSAAETGLADFILPADRMPEQLMRFIQHPLATPSTEISTLLSDPTKRDAIIQQLSRDRRIDFSVYKPTTFGRRIERRMGINHIDDLDRYIELLKESKTESQALTNDLLIGVTRFFRDSEAWEYIRYDVLPRIIRAAGEHETIRMWVSACSTGEEAYSLAIMMQECMEELGVSRDVKIFASDVDPRAIERAAAGVYPESMAANVSGARLERFFRRRNDTYEIVRQIRERVIFVTHNLIKDPPFTRIDLATCRNFLIYLQPHVQRRVVALLHFALKPDGFLYLGSSETVGDCAGGFHVSNEKLKIYQKLPNTTLEIPRHGQHANLATQLHAPLHAPDPRDRRREGDGVLTQVFRSLTEQFAPPGLVLNAKHEILHSLGSVSRYIELPSGVFSSEATSLIKGDLRIPLTTALRRVARENKPVTYPEVRVRLGERVETVNLIVQQIKPNEASELLFAVFFEQARPPLDASEAEPFDMTEHENAEIVHLQRELKHTKENLQASIEELETTNEELQSTNEELLASNEELQSTNEELNSVNEELYTINTEYRTKIEQLVELTNDFGNLLRSTDIGTIFVDRELRIRKFTPAVLEFINLYDEDVGRPIDHFTHTVGEENFAALIRSVMQDGHVITKEIQSLTGKWLLMRVLPFLTQDDATDGAVITFVDVTSLKSSEAALRRSEQRYHAALASRFDAFFLLERATNEHGEVVDFEFTDVNERGAELVGARRERLVGRRLCETLPVFRSSGLFDKYKRAIETGAALEEEFPINDPQVQAEWLRQQAIPLSDGLAINLQDITDRKRAEQELRTGEARFRTAFDNALIGMALVAPDGRFLRVNAALCDFIGYEANELLNQTAQAVTAPEDVADDEQRRQDLLEAREVSYQTVKRYVRKDGSLAAAAVSVALVRDAQNRPLYFIKQIQPRVSAD